jgi:hypothetical protein
MLNLNANVIVEFTPITVVGGWSNEDTNTEAFHAEITFSVKVQARINMGLYGTLYEGKNITGQVVTDPGGGWHLMGPTYSEDRGLDFFIYQALTETVYQQRELLERMAKGTL